MSDKISIRFYKDREVRAIWNEDENKWYFSIVDIVAAISGSPRPRVYWGTVKNRQKATHDQLYSKCIQLKLATADGKHYATDCFAQEDIEAVVKTLPAKNTTDFLDWFTYSGNTYAGIKTTFFNFKTATKGELTVTITTSAETKEESAPFEYKFTDSMISGTITVKEGEYSGKYNVAYSHCDETLILYSDVSMVLYEVND